MSEGRAIAISDPAPRTGAGHRSFASKALLVVLGISVLAHVLVTLQPPFADEFVVVQNVWHFVNNRTIVAAHTQYPTLYSYLIAPLVGVSTAALVTLGIPPSAADASELMAYQPLYAFWPARLVTLLSWAGVVWVTYRIGRELLGSSRAALMGCVAVASALGTLRYSGYALPDITTAFLGAGALLYMLRLARGESLARSALLAGILAGLSVAAKYSGVAIAIPAVLAAWLAPQATWRVRLGLSGRLVGGMALGFLIGCPGWVVAPQVYWAGLQTMRLHMAAGHLGYAGIPVLGQLELLVRADGLLVVLALAGMISAIAFVKQPSVRRCALVLAALLLGTLLVNAPARKQSLQFLFVMYPALAVLAAVVFEAPGRRHVPVATGVYACGFAVSALAALLWAVRVTALPYSLEVADKWIHAHVPRDAVVAVDWSYVPPMLSADDLATVRRAIRTPFLAAIYEAPSGYETVPIEHDAGFLGATRATYLVTSSGCYDRFFRYGLTTRLPPPHGAPLREAFVERRRFYSELFRGEADWRLAYEAYTGNGPTVRVYRRGARDQGKPATGSVPGPGPAPNRKSRMP